VADPVKSLALYMMIGIVIVIGISQFNRLIGAILGVIFWIAVAIVGTSAYDQGGGVGIPGYVFPQPMFYTLCVVFGVVSAIQGLRAWGQKRRNRQIKSMQNDE
jgi:hypothetical protein